MSESKECLISAAPDLLEALATLVAANEAVQLVLCNGPEVPGLDPNALGVAQMQVVAAENRARVILSRARGEA